MTQTDKKFFYEVLGEYIIREQRSSDWLAKTTDIPEPTIRNWREGKVKRPRSWRDIVKVAVALHLNSNETTRLLTAAGHHSISHLLATNTNNKDETLLSHWAEEETEKPRANVPLQLPRREKHFVGRKSELTQILDSLLPGNVFTLWGPGGIGKTALAVESIWKLKEKDILLKRFPDGLVTYSFYDQPITSLAFEHIVHSFDSTIKNITFDIARRILAKKRALVLLDGAEEADNLGSILNVLSTSGVLITTRSRSDALESVQNVEAFNQENAVELLNVWAEKEIDFLEAAENICDLVGGLPLAVRLAGRYLRQSKTKASEYRAWLHKTPLDALNHGSRRQESVPILLERSLQQVSVGAVKILAVSGVLGLAPFSRTAITSVLNFKEYEILRWFGELVNYGLITRINERYKASHALIHTYARKQLEVDEETLELLVNYYIKLSKQHRNLGVQGFRTIEKERIHLMRLIAYSREQKKERHVKQLIEAFEWYLNSIPFIPTNAGFVTNKLELSQSSLSNRQIIYISTVATNYSTQKAVIEILKFFIERWKIKLIMVEGGGKGDVSLSDLREKISKDNRERFAERDLKAGILSTPDYLSLVLDDPLIIYAVDDDKLYGITFDAWDNAVEIKNNLAQYYEKNKEELNLLQQTALPYSIEQIEGLKRRLDSNEIGFTDFILNLKNSAKQLEIDLNEYSNIMLLLMSFDMEKAFTMTGVSKAFREAVFLVPKMGQENDVDNLVAIALAFKLKIVSKEDYLLFVVGLMKKYGSWEKELSDLYQYCEYLEVKQSVNVSLLMDEIDKLINTICFALAATDKQRQLVRAIRLIRLMWKVADMKLLPYEYRDFQKYQGEIAESISLIGEVVEENELPINSSELYKLVDAAQKSIKFYDAAIERADIIANNAIETMDKMQEKTAVLITTGFIQSKVKASLDAKGERVISITPFTSEPTDEDVHNEVMRLMWRGRNNKNTGSKT